MENHASIKKVLLKKDKSEDKFLQHNENINDGSL